MSTFDQSKYAKSFIPKEEVKRDDLPEWLIPISKSEMKLAHRKASEAKAPFCTWDPTSNVTHKSKSEKRNEQKKKVIEVGRELRAARVQVPDHISVLRYNSVEWSNLLLGEDGEYWKNGKGITQGLWTVPKEPIRQKTFEGWEPEAVRDHILSLNTDPKMQAIEEKFASKFGPYTPLPYDEWADQVHALWMDVPWTPDLETLEWAKDQVLVELRESLRKNFACDKLVPLSVDEALPKVQKGRNSGWPFFTSKWASKPECLEYYTKQAEQLLRGEDVLSGTPHILFKRVQPNGMDTVKMRPVECPPKSEAIAAKCLTDKFVELFKVTEPYAGFNGGERIHEILGPFMEYEYLVESDFSKFDQRVVHLMRHVFHVIMKLVPQAYWRYLQITLNYYQNAKLITPMGVLEAADGRLNGLLSGEGWTSVIGTIANSIAVKYTMKRMGVDDYRHLAFGDDIAIATNRFDLDKFERYMLELGMDCNQSKQNVSSGPEAYFSFLGWYHFRDDWKLGNEGKFPMSRIAPGLYYREFFTSIESAIEDGISEEAVERLRQSPIGLDVIALISKLNNCRNNRNFIELVRFVREHSPKRLSTEYIMPLSELKDLLRQGRRTRGVSLADMPVVRVLYYLEEQEQSAGLLAEQLETVIQEVERDTVENETLSPKLEDYSEIGGMPIDFFL